MTFIAVLGTRDSWVTWRNKFSNMAAECSVGSKTLHHEGVIFLHVYDPEAEVIAAYEFSGIIKLVGWGDTPAYKHIELLRSRIRQQ